MEGNGAVPGKWARRKSARLRNCRKPSRSGLGAEGGAEARLFLAEKSKARKDTEDPMDSDPVPESRSQLVDGRFGAMSRAVRRIFKASEQARRQASGVSSVWRA